MGFMQRASAHVNLEAVRRNIATLRSRAPQSSFMSVVKADGYGHGMISVSRASRDAGAEYLGVALPSEAMELRDAGDTGSILTWLYTPDDDLSGCAARGVDISAASSGMLRQVVAAARTADRRVRLHLKIDTGLGRNGLPPAQWPTLVAEAKRQQAAGSVEIVGIWSHLASADEPASPATQAQVSVFEDSLAVAEGIGVTPQIRHLANSAGLIAHPTTHYDLVRCGIAVYGLSPGELLGTAADLELVPAMTVRAVVAMVKEVPGGHGVSYGQRYRTSGDTRLALIPVGYGDGIPRVGSARLQMQVNGQRFTVAGTVAMDQVVLDIGDAPVQAGDVVELFGDGLNGAPTADEWAAACGTINYEIVTRLGPRIPRTYLQETSHSEAPFPVVRGSERV
jgi:alanine racemase